MGSGEPTKVPAACLRNARERFFLPEIDAAVRLYRASAANAMQMQMQMPVLIEGGYDRNNVAV